MGESLLSWSWFGMRRRASRSACRLAGLALLLGLGACNPAETWRDWTGASQNDPDPDTTPNTKNLAAGEAVDYPNLATVPAPPIRAMTAAEREKLTQSLIADRTNARYSDEQLRAGFSASNVPPPVAAGAAAEPGNTQPELAGTPRPLPQPAVPPTQPAGRLPGNYAAAAAPRSSAPMASSVSATPPVNSDNATGEKPAAASTSAPRSARIEGKKLSEPGEGLRKQGEPPEPGPMESSLEMPQARATPQPEQVEPVPAPPQLPPAPKVANAQPSLPTGLAAGGVLTRAPSAAASGSAGFQPAPPAPELPPVAPSRSAAAGDTKTAAKPPVPTGTPVAEIKFAGDSTGLTDKDRQILETVLPVYQQNPGKVRIVGYAGGGSGAVEKLNNYRAALDRAQAVAAALSQAGIPSDKIQVEAAPAGAGSGESRAEVLLER
jgi:outer membrane protein OmpA-like peptidoglycan-associated protein